ncbi:MAG: divalent-cation tolerance protein CutA, partial [bacterium]
ANQLIEKRLAACVNIIKDVHSIYWWEGKIVKDKEELLVIKSRYELYPELENEIRALHPYTIPEILILPVTGGNKEYLQWVMEETKSGFDENP